MRESVKIFRLENGYVVFSDTSRAEGGQYCANMKGVISELYRVFEGTSKMTKDQVAFLKGGAQDARKAEGSKQRKNQSTKALDSEPL